MASGKPRFRPMGLGDFFDETFDLYKTNFVLLASIAAVLYLPVVMAMNLVMVKIQAEFSGMAGGTAPSDFTPYLRCILLLGGAYFLYAIIYPIVTGAFTYAISQRYLGESTTTLQSYRFVMQRFFVVVFTLLLATIIIFIPYLGACVIIGITAGVFGAMRGGESAAIVAIFGVLLVIPALLATVAIAIRLIFVPTVTMVEGRKYSDALKRSWQLTSGHFWRVLGIVLLLWILVAMVSAALTSPLQIAMSMTSKPGVMSPFAIPAAALNSLVSSAVMPIMFIVTVLLYFDVRIRKEGFDLQMLARDMAIASGQPVPEIAYPVPSATVTSAVTVSSQSETANSVESNPLHPEWQSSADLCAFCGFPIYTLADAKTCESCGQTFHGECWEEKGGCRTRGCSANPSTAQPE